MLVFRKGSMRSGTSVELGTISYNTSPYIHRMTGKVSKAGIIRQDEYDYFRLSEDRMFESSVLRPIEDILVKVKGDFWSEQLHQIHNRDYFYS